MKHYCGTITKDYKGLYYFSVFDLVHSLDNWAMDTTIVKNEEQDQAFIEFYDMIPVKTNYTKLESFNLLWYFVSGKLWVYEFENRPFGSSITNMKTHLTHFRHNRNGCSNHHKVALSKAQYDILAIVLDKKEPEVDTWTTVDSPRKLADDDASLSNY
jgi:hypothetical protein